MGSGCGCGSRGDQEGVIFWDSPVAAQRGACPASAHLGGEGGCLPKVVQHLVPSQAVVVNDVPLDGPEQIWGLILHQPGLAGEPCQHPDSGRTQKMAGTPRAGTPDNSGHVRAQTVGTPTTGVWDHRRGHGTPDGKDAIKAGKSGATGASVWSNCECGSQSIAMQMWTAFTHPRTALTHTHTLGQPSPTPQGQPSASPTPQDSPHP